MHRTLLSLYQTPKDDAKLLEAVPSFFLDTVHFEPLTDPVIIDRSGVCLNKNQLKQFPHYTNPYTRVRMILLPDGFSMDAAFNAQLKEVYEKLENASLSDKLKQRYKIELNIWEKKLSQQLQPLVEEVLRVEFDSRQSQIDSVEVEENRKASLRNLQLEPERDPKNWMRLAKDYCLVYYLQMIKCELLQVFKDSRAKINELISENLEHNFVKLISQLEREHFSAEIIRKIISEQRESALIALQKALKNYIAVVENAAYFYSHLHTEEKEFQEEEAKTALRLPKLLDYFLSKELQNLKQETVDPMVFFQQYVNRAKYRENTQFFTSQNNTIFFNPDKSKKEIPVETKHQTTSPRLSRIHEVD